MEAETRASDADQRRWARISKRIDRARSDERDVLPRCSIFFGEHDRQHACGDRWVGRIG